MEIVHVRVDQNHMATTFELVVSCPSPLARLADQVLCESHLLVTRLESELSEFLSDSPVCILNHSQAFSRIAAPNSTIDLLERSELLRKLSGGSFDCGAKSKILLADKFGWSRDESVIWKLHDDVHLSFGAIGKGYALDQVRLLIERHGFSDYLLSAGGSSQVISGFSSPGKPWTWGWSWKRDQQGESLGLPFEHQSGSAIALGVSGTHEKGNHLIRPGAESKEYACQSALVACPSAADSDALSTALFISGWENGASKIQNFHFPTAAAVIDSSGTPKWNSRFRQLWGNPTAVATASLSTLLFLSSAQAKPAQTKTTRAKPTPAKPAQAKPAQAKPSHAKPAKAAPVATPTEEQAIDLGAEMVNVFNPYIFERSPIWILAPILMLSLAAVHLRKLRPKKLAQRFFVRQATGLTQASILPVKFSRTPDSTSQKKGSPE